MTKNHRTWLMGALAVLVVYALVLSGCAAPSQNSTQNTSQNETSSMGATSSTSPETSTSAGTSMTTTPETSTTTTMPPTSETTSTGTTGTTGATGKMWNMKQRVTVDGYQIAVLSRAFMTEVQGKTAPSGKRLLVVRIWIRNQTDGTRSISATDFVLTDLSGATIPPLKVSATSYLSGKTMHTLPAKTMKMYRIVYAVPKVDKQFTLTFTPPSGTATPVKITIK